jgi:hypothetical protein
VRSFGTTTTALLELTDWLNGHGCTHVAMEATGVYWKPIWHILEEDFELMLANASHIKNVPGRKTGDRCERRHLDRRPLGVLTDPFELRVAHCDPGSAGSDPDAQTAGAGNESVQFHGPRKYGSVAISAYLVS